MAGKRSPIYDWHAQNGARFFEYGGWEIPETYGKMEVEYAALRNGAGLVDLCHESRLRIEGEDMIAFANELSTIDVNKIEQGNSSPAYICNQRGGIVDEVVIYRDQNFLLLLGNGIHRNELLEWLEEHHQRRPELRVAVTDVSAAQLQVGLRGPGSLPLLERVTFGQRFQLEPGQAVLATIGTARCLAIKRLLAPDGFDLVVGSVFLQPIWEKLMDAARATGARPVGYAAIEAYIIEQGYPRVGYEIDADTSPLEINMTHRIDFQKPQFYGRRALMHSTSNEFARTLVMLRFDQDRRVDPGAEIFFENMPVGRVTSRCFSPMARATLAMGFVNSIKSAPGTRLTVLGRDTEGYIAEIIRPSAVNIQVR